MRPPTESELPILEYLFAMAGLNQDPQDLRIEPMSDGKMGSLLFENLNGVDRRLGETAAECCFEDADGALVTVTLNLDQHGALFELDIWKVDFSKLQRWPLKNEIRTLPWKQS
ncbi:DUF6984 family protein [Acaryochloris marina NIES-2412]|uniref:DUF6984 family protein n=1 Tax=Acaryochloris marina TaxID=155978 RepID=UPI004059680F